MTQRKIGFACKWIDHPGQLDKIKPTDDCKRYNTGTTTVAWLNRQNRDQAVEKLWQLLRENTESIRLLVERVGALEPALRMVRLSSDVLPMYTEANWSWFWKQPDVREECSRRFAIVGDTARRLGVRISFHPGQFCVLASESDDIVRRSIEEFEYHVDMARWMGFGIKFQDFKINVHIAGRRGPEGIREALKKLSPEARNTLTIENDEITWGVEHSLELVKDCALVLDIHHHYIHSGEYIQATDDRIQRFIESWRGARPVIHYSVSREDIIGHLPQDSLPDLQILLESGHKKGHLRAHSDFYWNKAVNQWALTHSTWADIMCESKGKNLASFALYEEAKTLGLF